MWPWLGPPLVALRYVMYFRFYGWRHVGVWRCVEGWTFKLLPLVAFRYLGGVWCLLMPCFKFMCSTTPSNSTLSLWANFVRWLLYSNLPRLSDGLIIVASTYGGRRAAMCGARQAASLAPKRVYANYRWARRRRRRRAVDSPLPAPLELRRASKHLHLHHRPPPPLSLLPSRRLQTSHPVLPHADAYPPGYTTMYRHS